MRLVIYADLLGDSLEKRQHLPESHGSPMKEHSSPLSFHDPVRPKLKGQRCRHQGAAMGVKTVTVSWSVREERSTVGASTQC